MKGKVFRYITVCCVFLALFALANFYCYQSAMNQFEKMQEDYESRVGEQVQVYVDNRMADRVEQLEKKVGEHNNYARRMPVVEEQIKVLNHRVQDLEAEK